MSELKTVFLNVSGELFKLSEEIVFNRVWDERRLELCGTDACISLFMLFPCKFLLDVKSILLECKLTVDPFIFETDNFTGDILLVVAALCVLVIIWLSVSVLFTFVAILELVDANDEDDVDEADDELPESEDDSKLLKLTEDPAGGHSSNEDTVWYTDVSVSLNPAVDPVTFFPLLIHLN